MQTEELKTLNRGARYRARHPDRAKEASRRWYLKNRGRYLAKRQAERHTDLEGYRARKRRWDGKPTPTRPCPVDVQHIKDGLKNMEERLGYRIEYNLDRADAVDARLDQHVETYHFPGVRP